MLLTRSWPALLLAGFTAVAAGLAPAQAQDRSHPRAQKHAQERGQERGQERESAATDRLSGEPTLSEARRWSSLGTYLAARHASAGRDAASASVYYRAALQADPRNTDLLDRAFLSALADGDMELANKLADQLLKADKSNRIARLVLGIRAMKQKQWGPARANLLQSVRGPITDLSATLLIAWATAGAGDPNTAVALIDKLVGPEWYNIFKELHAGLILERAGMQVAAGKRFERAYKLDSSALRVVEAYGRWASRNGAKDQALQIFETFDKALPRHPLIQEALASLRAGQKLPPMIDSVSAGAAEVLYGLGASVGRRGAEDLGLVYLQLALSLQPTHALALLSLADLYEALKKPELANRIYEKLPPKSPLYRNGQIQLAINLDGMSKAGEAETRLNALMHENPKDLEAILALGNVQRGRKEFTSCADTYSKALDVIGTPEKANWVIFYFRGICLERAKQWGKAEADLRKALELFPDQPQVLNYLGYSWVDQGINLDEGMKLIRKAVDQRPDDGYIVDSLGWAYYRIRNYPEAVKNLERAIELKPEDPTINDHLGDAYWQVGRKLEAQFQWAHARDLKPEEDDLPKILKKIKDGLPDDSASSADAEKDKKPGNNGG